MDHQQSNVFDVLEEKSSTLARDDHMVWDTNALMDRFPRPPPSSWNLRQRALIFLFGTHKCCQNSRGVPWSRNVLARRPEWSAVLMSDEFSVTRRRWQQDMKQHLLDNKVLDTCVRQRHRLEVRAPSHTGLTTPCEKVFFGGLLRLCLATSAQRLARRAAEQH